MKSRSSLLGLVLLVCALQGCVAWRYTTTPPVAGKVIDAEGGNPIAGAEVGFRKHEAASTRTNADGTFKLASGHEWGAAAILPFEFTPCGGVFYVMAPGYEAFETDMGEQVWHAVQLPDVKLRKKAK